MSEPFDATETNVVFEFSRIDDLVNQTLQFSPFQAHVQPESKGIPTGFHTIDEHIKGFQQGQVSTIAAKAGMGKTAFLLSLTYNLGVNQGRRVAIFSPERSARKLVQRLLESETGMSVNQLNQAGMKDSDKDHLLALINRIRDSRIVIDDKPHFNVAEFAGKCRQLVDEFKTEIILIDQPDHFVSHIQHPEIREAEMNIVTEGLSAIARELNVPVVMFTQVNPSYHLNGRDLSTDDLESHYVKASDNIIFLGRPSYRKPEAPPQEDLAEVLIAKHECCDEPRSVHLRYIESIDKFVDF